MSRIDKIKFIIITLLILLYFIISLHNPVDAFVQQDIPIGEEFVSGTITNQISNLSYAWVHTNETSLLSLTMFDEIYGCAPFYPFFGQSFSIENNSFFVGTVITGFELYQDSNENGVLDLEEELLYYVMLNGSQDYILPQIEKTTLDSMRIYSWKVGYIEVDGFLSPFTGPNFRKTIIDSVNLTYTFEIHTNYSELKLAITMGAWDTYEFKFEDETFQEIRLQDIDLTSYSLSILFGTTVSSEDPIDVALTDGTSGITDAIIEVNNIPVFQSFFQDTYDLGLNGSAYPARAIPASLDTLYDEQIQEWGTPQALYDWWGSFFSSMSELTTIPPLGIEEVSFLYRICYPVWNGEPFNHDPRYRALFESTVFPPATSTSEPSSSTSETLLTDQPTPSFLIPEVLVLLILIPVLRRKRNN